MDRPGALVLFGWLHELHELPELGPALEPGREPFVELIPPVPLAPAPHARAAEYERVVARLLPPRDDNEMSNRRPIPTRRTSSRRTDIPASALLRRGRKILVPGAQMRGASETSGRALLSPPSTCCVMACREHDRRRPASGHPRPHLESGIWNLDGCLSRTLTATGRDAPHRAASSSTLLHGRIYQEPVSARLANPPANDVSPHDDYDGERISRLFHPCRCPGARPTPANPHPGPSAAALLLQ